MDRCQSIPQISIIKQKIEIVEDTWNEQSMKSVTYSGEISLS